MSAVIKWTSEDGAALREFLRRISVEKIKAIMLPKCPAVIDAKLVKESEADAIARVAAMRAGWEAYEETFFKLADPGRKAPAESDFRDMT
jgi:hypothetical protein